MNSLLSCTIGCVCIALKLFALPGGGGAGGSPAVNNSAAAAATNKMPQFPQGLRPFYPRTLHFKAFLLCSDQLSVVLL